MARITQLSLETAGNPVTKSRAMCDQGQRGVGSDCNKPYGDWLFYSGNKLNILQQLQLYAWDYCRRTEKAPNAYFLKTNKPTKNSHITGSKYR